MTNRTESYIYLKDVLEGRDELQGVKVVTRPDGVCLFAGCDDNENSRLVGVLELCDGVLKLVVYADSERNEPTHNITIG
jgi:hypothetical protein